MEGTLSLFDWRPGASDQVHGEPFASPAPPRRDARRPRAGSAAKRKPADAADLPDVGDAAPVAALAKGSGPCDVAVIQPGQPGQPGQLGEPGQPGEPGEPGEPALEAQLAASASAAPAPVLAVSPPVVAGAAELRIVVFDCETTGTDRLQDQVIELCVQHGLADDAPSQVWRIKPAAPIHPGAQAVHGITLADLEHCPSFTAVADEIAAVFAVTDIIVGYNIAFDIDMLQAEYTRIGRPLLDLNGKKIIDAFRLWQQCEPRSLQHAHQRFVGNGFASAHSASADVAATGRVLSGMLRAFNLADQDWESIACKCDAQYAARASWVGPSRHLRWEGDVVVLGFGKHSNAPVHQLAAGPDRSFLRWVIERDFPVHVSEVCRAALDLPGEAFLAWARQRFAGPPSSSSSPSAK